MAERPEDLNLPTTVIAKLIKDALPDSVNVSKDARLAISKAASVFVLYATSCANNFAMQRNRKSIAAQDVLEAMSEMEFAQFIEPLKNCLEAYREGQKNKRRVKQQQQDKQTDEESAETSAAAAAPAAEAEDDDDGVEEINEEEEED